MRAFSALLVVMVDDMRFMDTDAKEITIDIIPQVSEDNLLLPGVARPRELRKIITKDLVCLSTILPKRRGNANVVGIRDGRARHM